MTELTYLFATVAVVLGLMTSISIWAPRRLWLKLTALGAAAVFMPIAYFSLAHLLSLPKPIGFEWWHDKADEATVLGSSMRENRGIYLWLQLPETEEPRSYVLPWSKELAEQLQAAQREAEENRSGVQMRAPFEPSLDDREAKFYALPQPALPPKDFNDPPPQHFEAPGEDA